MMLMLRMKVMEVNVMVMVLERTKAGITSMIFLTGEFCSMEVVSTHKLVMLVSDVLKSNATFGGRPMEIVFRQVAAIEFVVTHEGGQRV